MHIQRKIEIDCTPAQLWKCLTEPALLKKWVSQFVDDTPDDPKKTSGVGVASTMRLREGGKIVSYRCIVTDWKHERSLAIRFSGGSFSPGMEMDIAYEIETLAGGGTLLDFQEWIPLKGIYKLMSPLIRLMAAMNGKKDLAALKALAPTITT